MKTLLPLLLTLTVISCSGQKKLRIIHADSPSVTIREDGKTYPNRWSIDPETKVDILTTTAQEIAFITDKDSVIFKPSKIGDSIEFVVLFKGDTARTRIIREISHLELLRQGAKYNMNDNREIPTFKYQSQNDPNLVRLRKEMNLDSIAGKGTEVSKILNLLQWAHYVVRHDGNSYNPESQNALDIINICKKENRGVNCRMMAVMLNECYLAMGIPSRFITCMPKPTNFDDCHVINMVYSSELKKWLWIDPTFNAYVMDENGTLLGIEEVRQRLIDKDPLILNPNANWNRQSTQTKEYYLEYYMGKNLYRISAPIESRWNCETPEPGKKNDYVELLPLDGLIQETQPEYGYYRTNNPALFWAKP